MLLLSKISPAGTLMERWKFQRNGFIYSVPNKSVPRRKEPRWPSGVVGVLPPGSPRPEPPHMKATQPFLASGRAFDLGLLPLMLTSSQRRPD